PLRFLLLNTNLPTKTPLEMSSSQQINATSAQVQATNEGASIPVAATIPVISAPVLPLGLSSVPTASPGVASEITKGETREKLEPEAETVEIELHPGDSSRMVRIGANLPEDLKEQITRVLQEYAGIFAWSVADMPGIDRSVICHRLAVREGSRPLRQKKRYLASDRRDFVKKEVKDLLSVGHIREV
ncbi:unnamed protein product, partial [Cuscuta campestris]